YYINPNLSFFLFLFLSLLGLHAFSVSTTTSTVLVNENSGADMTCSFSADFGATPRVEWKFRDLKGTVSFIYFDGQVTIAMMFQMWLLRCCLGLLNGCYDILGGCCCFLPLLPPAVPVSRIPNSATTGSNVRMTCFDPEGSPPSTYQWYKDNTPLPEDPSKFPNFKNMTYKMNIQNGNLEFPSVAKTDQGQYFCEASNGKGPAQRGQPVLMQVRDLNTGGIAAGVIVALLAIAALIFGLWYANKKGYLPSNKPKTAVYTQPRQTYDEDDVSTKCFHYITLYLADPFIQSELQIMMYI
uniref:Junctional adhesion molecule A n=1 Tax=Astyanax mexicanus TaxID=7994 RepID=A0A8B9LNJ2_ASTMX